MELRCCRRVTENSPSSRVVMVRKVDERIFISKEGKELPKYEAQTTETVETFRCGNKTERRVTTRYRKPVDGGPGSASAPGPSRGSLQNLRRVCSVGTIGLNRSFRLSKSENCSESPTAKSSHKTSPHLSRKDYSTNRSLEPLTVKKNTSNLVPSHIVKENQLVKQQSIYSEFEKECLRAHNEYRLKHQVSPLKLNKRLCKFSEEWAKHLVTKGRLEYRNNSDYGENMFCLWSSQKNHTVTGRDPVDSWYKEITKHPFGREPSTLQSGHFSQVVWKESRQLGVGMARSGTNHVYIVANYYPAGNIMGSFADNVPPSEDWYN